MTEQALDDANATIATQKQVPQKSPAKSKRALPTSTRALLRAKEPYQRALLTIADALQLVKYDRRLANYFSSVVC